MVHFSKHWKNCTSIPILSSPSFIFSFTFPLFFLFLFLLFLFLFFLFLFLSFLLIVRYLFASRGSSLMVHPLKHWKNYTSIHFDSIVFLFSLSSLIKIHTPLSYNVACLRILLRILIPTLLYPHHFRSNSNAKDV